MKIYFAFGFILHDTVTGLQYHHPSGNNNKVLEQLFVISNQDDLGHLYEQINIDFLEWVQQQCPNSSYVATIVAWFGRSGIIQLCTTV